MGSWGVGLFSDDTACDVRDDYEQALREGVGDEPARDRVLAEFVEDDGESDSAVWLALAATQHKLGRLDEMVKAKALDIINSGSDLGIWAEEGADLAARRQKVLLDLQAKLLGPPNKRTEFRSEPKHVTSLQTGDVLELKAQGRVFLFVVNEIDRGKIDTAPILDGLQWDGARRPNRWKLRKLVYDRLNDTYHGRYAGPAWMPKRMRVHTKGGGDYSDAGFVLVRRIGPPRESKYTCPHSRTNWQALAETLRNPAYRLET